MVGARLKNGRRAQDDRDAGGGQLVHRYRPEPDDRVDTEDPREFENGTSARDDALEVRVKSPATSLGSCSKRIRRRSLCLSAIALTAASFLANRNGLPSPTAETLQVQIRKGPHRGQREKRGQGQGNEGGQRVLDWRAHIVYAVSRDHLVGALASARSILENTATPEFVTIHFFRLCEKDGTECDPRDGDFDPVRRRAAAGGAAVEVHDYTREDVKPYVNRRFSDKAKEKKGNLMDPSNYVRFILPERLSHEFCLWIDADTLVQKDVVSFLGDRDKSKVIAGIVRERTSLNGKIVDKLHAKFGIDVSPRKPTFNAGILVINLKLWRERDVTRQIELICQLNNDLKLWTDFGSQPPLQILFSGDRFEHLSTKLYANGLGYRRNARIDTSRMFLHWNGQHKPWMEGGLNREYWKRYVEDGKPTASKRVATQKELLEGASRTLDQPTAASKTNFTAGEGSAKVTSQVSVGARPATTASVEAPQIIPSPSPPTHTELSILGGKRDDHAMEVVRNMIKQIGREKNSEDRKAMEKRLKKMLLPNRVVETHDAQV